MSRYVQIRCELRELAEIEAGLRALGLAPERATIPGGLCLAGSLECAGEPVDLRLPAGSAGSVEDFGWRREADGGLLMICGEPDRAHLGGALLQPLRQICARNRAIHAARSAGLEVVETATEAGDGSIRLVLRRS